VQVKRVVITRPSGPYSGSKRLAGKLEAVGIEVFELPLLKCVPLDLSANDRSLIIQSLQQDPGGWIAFLSPTAVWVWSDLIAGDSVLASATQRAKIAVQGSGTAKAVIECLNRVPDFTPSVFVAEEFAREFARALPPNRAVIVPQSADGRDLFAPILRVAGFGASGIDIYRLEANGINKESLDSYRSFVREGAAIVFMSPSAVAAAARVLQGSLGTDKIVSIGPITTQAIKQAGLTVWREAQEHSEDGVLKVLVS
jgi:uroporphyrinogen III methyltransferase/synthase